MFSGIVKHTGKISKIYKNSNNCGIEILSKIKFSKFEIGSSVSCSGTCLTLEKYKRNLSKFYISKETLNRTNFKFSKSELGSSISCSGACLTLEKYKGNLSKFYISKETLNRTNFQSLNKGDIVNLEKSLKYGDRISGHFVQGHVDTRSKIKKIDFVGKSWFIDFKIEKLYKKYLVQKGSITINGVSLTVSKILKDGFRIVIIPRTLKLTNLIFLKEKDTVNIEFDVLGKYIKGFLK